MAWALIVIGVDLSLNERFISFALSPGLKTTTAIEPSGFWAAVAIRESSDSAYPILFAPGRIYRLK